MWGCLVVASMGSVRRSRHFIPGCGRQPGVGDRSFEVCEIPR